MAWPPVKRKAITAVKASPAEKAGVFTTPATGGRKASKADTGHASGRRVVEVRNGDLDVYRQRVTVQDGQPAPVVGHEFK